MDIRDTFFRLILAAILGGIIGYERELKGTNAGLRTHILVSLGSALTMLLSLYMLDSLQKGNFDAAQIVGSVMTGIGFIGAGTIIKNDKGGIDGLTTAASIWMSASIGLAAGGG